MPRAKPVPEDAPTEPIWWLRSLPHYRYLQTNWWRRRRTLFLESIDLTWGQKRCGLCGITHLDASRYAHPTGTIEITFDVHHKSYEKTGYETDDDLILLCAPCHNLVHYPDSLPARHWLEVNDHLDDLTTRAAELTPDAYRSVR